MGIVGNSLRFIFRGFGMFSGWIFGILWKGFKFALKIILILLILLFLLKSCLNVKSKPPVDNKPKVTHFNPPKPYDPFYKHYLEDK